jgi:hypothetical protein
MDEKVGRKPILVTSAAGFIVSQCPNVVADVRVLSCDDVHCRLLAYVLNQQSRDPKRLPIGVFDRGSFRRLSRGPRH